ncbi:MULTISPECIES: hypothetical protein [unclassified Bradyrhizobium]|uniref:hypothetical protein n=1 Tax=unclassified Bradyrhizobium TaxID=2631580 RepID=UPI0029165365|nr:MULTISPECIES: hypothetical protein [unclassified Bradyrhizobium]
MSSILLVLIIFFAGFALATAIAYLLVRHFMQFLPNGPAAQTASDQFHYNARLSLLKAAAWGSAIAGAVAAALFVALLYNIIPDRFSKAPTSEERVAAVLAAPPRESEIRNANPVIPPATTTSRQSHPVDERLLHADCAHPFTIVVRNFKPNERVYLPQRCDVQIIAMQGGVTIATDQGDMFLVADHLTSQMLYVSDSYLQQRGPIPAEVRMRIIPRSFCPFGFEWNYDRSACTDCAAEPTSMYCQYRKLPK